MRRDLRVALSGPAGQNALITLKVGGDPQLTIVRDLQRDPIKRVVTHVDFLRINRDEEIEVEVPIHLEGEATEVLRNDGLVDQSLDHLTVIAKPGDIPPSFTIDVSAMVIGDVIRVHDLALPAGVTTPLDPETPLVTAEATRATIEEEAGEGEEGEGGRGRGRRGCRRVGGERRQRRRLTHPVPPRRLRAAREGGRLPGRRARQPGRRLRAQPAQPRR